MRVIAIMDPASPSHPTLELTAVDDQPKLGRARRFQRTGWLPGRNAARIPPGFGVCSAQSIAVLHPISGSPMGAHTHPAHFAKGSRMSSVGCKKVPHSLVESQ